MYREVIAPSKPFPMIFSGYGRGSKRMIRPVQRQRVSETTKNFLFFSAVPSQVATPMTTPATKRLKSITLDWQGLAEVFLQIKSCATKVQPDDQKQTILNCSEYFGTYDGICPPSGNSLEHEASDCLRRGPRQASRSTVPLTAKTSQLWQI